MNPSKAEKKTRVIIALHSVSMTRGGKEVLQDISWTTRQGEHWFIMGNNGSGKTTMMEVIMGYLWPQRGSVSVLGNRFGEVYLQELRRRIGYVSPWIFKHLGDHVPVEDVIASGTDASVGYYGEFTHHLNDIISPFSHGLLMKEGRIFYQGRRDEVLQGQRLAEAFDLPDDIL